MMYGERIKAVRKATGLTQTDFAERIGLKQSSLSYIELDKTGITEQNIKLISGMFNVNENWLRTGEGKMFNSNADELFRMFALDNTDEKIIKEYMKLSDKQKKAFGKFIDTIIEDKE